MIIAEIAAQVEKFELDMLFHVFLPGCVTVIIWILVDGMLIKRSTRKKMKEMDDKRKKMDNYKKGIKDD